MALKIQPKANGIYTGPVPSSREKTKKQLETEAHGMEPRIRNPNKNLLTQ